MSPHFNTPVGIKSSQRSVRGNWEIRSRSRDLFTKTFTHGFIQDITLGLIPIRAQHNNPPKVTLEPSNPAVERIVAQGLEPSDRFSDFPDALRHFVEECAQTMLMTQTAITEIAYTTNVEDPNTPGFELIQINPLSLRRRFGKTHQYIPRHIAEQWKVPEKVYLPEDTLLIFVLPEFPHFNIDQTLNNLRHLSEKLLPSFVHDNMLHPTIPFEFVSFDLARKLALASAAKAIGWNANGLFGELNTEYYVAYRYLIFQKFRTMLLDSIISKLNEGLDRVGKQLRFEARIVTGGLPKLAQLNAAIDELQAGRCSAAPIIKRFIDMNS